MASKELFTIPIAAQEAHPAGGAVVCTEPAERVYLLTWTAAPDNRLTPAFCAAVLAALDAVEARLPPGVVVTTSGVPKFYSNGLDLAPVMRDPAILQRAVYPLFRRLLTFPMPTVALMPGHAFAAGLMLAMHHDYRIFADGSSNDGVGGGGGGSGGSDNNNNINKKTGRGGLACINELEFGVPLMPPMSSIFRLKLSAPAYRQVVLEARRFDAAAARDAGLVDEVGGGPEAALALVRGRDLVRKGMSKGGVYGLLKAEMYRESVALLDARGPEAGDFAAVMAAEKRRTAELERRVEEARVELRGGRASKL